METPSSTTRRVTRSQTLAAAYNNSSLRKVEESEKELTETRQRTVVKQQDRSALFDITNDSPIVGLAMGVLETPSSVMSKKRVISRGKLKKQENSTTPGSGEALLRGQVKNLLQKVNEEADLSKFKSEQGPFLALKALVNSPMGGLIIAPTPANTPQLLSLSAQSKELGSPAVSPVEDKFLISQMISGIIEGKEEEDDKNLILTRSLLVDFSEKSEEESFSSVVTYQATESSEDNKEKTTNTEDDDASVWSIQVNASTTDEQEDGFEEECGDDEKFYRCYDYDEEEEVGESSEWIDDDLNQLCEGISKMTVGTTTAMPKFAGKHKRFCYNSDGELVGEEEEEVCGEDDEDGRESSSSGALRLKGLPTPTGKHIRFPNDE